MTEYEKHGEETDGIDTERPSDAEETPRKQKQQKSPLLTAHRLSTTSLDEVNLTGSKEDEPSESQRSTEDRKPTPPPLPSRDSPSSQTSQPQGLSGSLPSVPWGPPPVNKSSTSPAPPPPQPQTRKLPGPFSWLTRASTGSVARSPPPPQSSRRNTGASVSTLSSNVGLHDGEDPDGSSVGSRKPRRNSLKDQFKLLRMREEGPGSENDEASVASRPASVTHGSPPSIPEEDGVPPTPALSAGPTSTVNSKLAPGTVSGISASATDASAPVDWELWQQLVNHGPPALTGTSSDELNAAIKRGIPQTIRGVIWQVLADSRSLELEEVYRDLVVRGTDKDVDRQRAFSGQVNVNGEKESLPSSRSSIRSDRSASQSTSVSPFREGDVDKVAKEQAAAENARKKKAKEDAVALQRLEKTIRRDLGARTSYSRYFVSQGNQESLFGLCKAYALYDEGVGYAQGMNFIAMPLLFNVSHRTEASRKRLTNSDGRG